MRVDNRSFFAVFILLLIYILFIASVNIPAVRNAIATKTPTPYSNLPLYNPSEIPFYTSAGDSNFVPIINFKGITTKRYNWSQELAPMPFLIDGDRLLFAGHIQEFDKYKQDNFHEMNSELLCVDINSGQVLWQDWVGMPNLVIDESHVIYVPSTRDFVPPGLVAYDVASGTKIWETRFHHDFGNIDTFYQIESDIYVTVHVGRSSYSSYIVDRKTGKIKQYFEDEARYKGSDGVSSGGVILKRYYFGYGPVQAFSLTDQSLLWANSEPIVSNIAADNHIAYFVTMNTQLVAVNIQTGEILGRLYFTPKFDPNFDYYDPEYNSAFDFLNEAPSVAADNGYVAVYFEDKKQLSVFRFIGGK